MAEVAGLAFGAVTLITLFNTCVEFLDFFEDMNNVGKDVKIAVTKVNFLRLRFFQWSKDVAIDAPDFTEKVLRDRWPDDSEALYMGLVQIADILGSATSLSSRYRQDAGACRLTLGERVNTSLPNGSQVSIRRLRPPASTKPTYSLEPRESSDTVIRKLSFLRLKFQWAVQDKKRFNSLVADLESLINSLEELSAGSRLSMTSCDGLIGNLLIGRAGETQRPAPIMSSHPTNDGKRAEARSSNTSAKRYTPSGPRLDGQSGQFGSGSISQAGPMVGGHTSELAPNCPTGANIQTEHQTYPQDSGNAALEAVLKSASRHHAYIAPKVDQSMAIAGNGSGSGGTCDAPGNVYYDLSAKGNSAVMFGDVDAEQVDNFFKTWATKK